MKRIQCSHGPVGDTDGQQHEGDDGVEQSGHDVTDGPAETHTHTHRLSKQLLFSLLTHEGQTEMQIETHLLPSLSKAIAMRTRFLRNMSIKTMETSVKPRVTTKRNRRTHETRSTAEIQSIKRSQLLKTESLTED